MKNNSESRSPGRWVLVAIALFVGAWLAHPAQAVGFCGDGYCSRASEDEWSCPEDCGSENPYCGDGTCNGSESCVSCVVDCGQCPPPTSVVQAYTCPDTDTRFVGECPGMCGPRCMGVYDPTTGQTIKKWTCECLKYGLSASTCLASGVGCVGSQADEVWSIANRPDLGPQGMDGCDLSGAPTPAQYCSYYGNSETKPVKPGLEPCSGERLLDAKYLGVDGGNPRWADFYGRWRWFDDKNAAMFTLSEPGRFKLGISCRYSGFGVVRVGPDSLLCRARGKCTAEQRPNEDDIDYLLRSPGCYFNYSLCNPFTGECSGTGGGCAEIPLYHKCGIHGFGWYDATQVPAGTYVAFAGTIDGHGTMDTYVYEGGGGVNYALGSTGCPAPPPPPPPPPPPTEECPPDQYPCVN